MYGLPPHGSSVGAMCAVDLSTRDLNFGFNGIRIFNTVHGTLATCFFFVKNVPTFKTTDLIFKNVSY